MQALTENQIRASLLNVSQSERKNVTLPGDLAESPWDEMDFYDARDCKLALVGYVVALVDDEPAGLLLRQAEAKPRTREAYTGFDVEAARAARIAAMRENVTAFVRAVRDGV
ncbi:FBP domain-containing protein [Microbacterium lacticum]